MYWKIRLRFRQKRGRLKRDAIWFESAIARENAKLKPVPVQNASTVPAIEIRGAAVYLQFAHLDLILILDQKFYVGTLKSLLTNFRAVLTFRDGRVGVRYRLGIAYPLERLVIARTADYWSVRLRSETVTSNNQTIADYRASNIVVEKSSEVRAHDQWRTEEDKRNFDKPNRTFAIRSDIRGEFGYDTGLHRINQILDADFIPDRGLLPKPTRPEGYGSDEKGEDEEGNAHYISLYTRAESPTL
jgi:hypothetical protein